MLGPIEALPSEMPPRRPRLREVDAECRKECAAGPRYAKVRGPVRRDRAALYQRVGEPDTEPAGDVIVTGARNVQFGGDDILAERHDSRGFCNHRESFDSVCHICVRDAVEALSSTAFDAEQSARDELREMSAGRRGRRARPKCKLARGKLSAVEKREQHRSAAGFADKRCNAGYLGIGGVPRRS